LFVVHYFVVQRSVLFLHKIQRLETTPDFHSAPFTYARKKRDGDKLKTEAGKPAAHGLNPATRDTEKASHRWDSSIRGCSVFPRLRQGRQDLILSLNALVI
jgi:hypothetical protein